MKILFLLGVALSSHLLPAQVPLGAPETGFGPPLPRTLPELLDKADLVVRGTVVAVSGPWAQESDGPEGRPPTHIVRHLQTVEIQSVIKGDADLVRRRVVVKQTGGTVRVNGQEVSSLTRTRIFGEGDDVILLLEAFGQPAENVYYVTHAPAGALFVDAAGMTTLTRGLLTYPEFRRVSRGSKTTAATAETILRDATSGG